MRHATLSLVLGSFLFLTGCEPTASQHSLITPEVAIFEPSLVGDWIAESKDDSQESAVLTFSRRDESNPLSKEYAVKWREGEERQKWVGLLGRVNEQLYLDLSPEVELNGDGSHILPGVYVEPAFEQKHQVIRISDELLLEIQPGIEEVDGTGTACPLGIKVSPIHWFFNVRLTEKGLRMGYLDDEDLSKQIKDKKIQINHVLEPEFFLIAKTDQLQRMVTQLGQNPATFTWLEFVKGEAK